MKNSEIETWARKIIDQVLEGRPLEDDLVELKREWIESKKAARQIAGACNAARGEPVLWIIGVDEKHRELLPVDPQEFSTWYRQVESEFDKPAPEINIVNLYFEIGCLVAICFRTDSPPYVIKNPKPESVHREVPWRIGNSTQSASRDQLLRLLIPVAKLPSLTSIGAKLKLIADRNGSYSYYATMAVFVEGKSADEMVFARQLSDCRVVAFPEGTMEAPKSTISFRGANISDKGAIARVNGTGQIEINFQIPPEQMCRVERDANVRLEFTTRPSGFESYLKLSVEMERFQQSDNQSAIWMSGDYDYPFEWKTSNRVLY
jgi:hypothetical protein